MLGWLFKRSKDKAPAPATTPTRPPAAAPRPVPVATPAVDRTADLEAARGNDEALLALLREPGVPLPIKLSAVEAIDGEAALQQAERELRSRDRRVHQLSKQRLRSKSAARKTREEAARLLASARSLAGADQVGVNRIVELDRAWQGLDASVIDAADREAFTALTAQLAARIRERADLELQRRRWHAEAVEAVRQLRSACLAAAEGGQDRAALAGSIDAARGVHERLPGGAAADAADAAGAADAAAERAAADLRQAIEHALALDEHLAVLDRLLAMPAEAPGTAQPDSTAADERPAAAEAALPVEDPERLWQALVPLPDAQWAALLKARHARGQQARRSAQHDRQTRQREQDREQDREKATGRRHEQPPERDAVPLAALSESIERSEQALDDGRLNEAQRELSRFDGALRGHDAPEPLRARLQAARARLAQLRGWQHWAGSQARDELVLQAEALAAATVGGAGAVSGAGGSVGGDSGRPGDPAGLSGAGDSADVNGAGDEAGSNGTTEAGEAGEPGHAGDPGRAVGSDNPDTASEPVISDAAAEVARLSLRQRADIIDTLRARWKEIDRHGNAGSQALWRRFDAALKTAYEPVAAQVAAQRAARQANLQARWQLLEALEALGGTAALATSAGAPDAAAVDAAAAPAAAPPAADAATEPPSDARTPPDPRTLADALARFHTEWRKLGPVQHTVPRAEQAALNQRMQSAVSRIEAPLQAARSRARAEREALVARARVLAGEVPSRGRDAVAEVRALQAEWQQHAKGLPLARGDEQALWTDFKAATDAVFEARQAAFNEREAEFEANATERAALIERLRVDAESSAVSQRRLLAEIDAAWQRCGPAPRARAAALDAEFRIAREALLQWLGDSARREWQTVFDALEAKLALCAAREQEASGEGVDGAAPGDDPDALARSWQALPVLPAPFEESLCRRAGLAPAADADPSPSTDDLLLQIETAWDLPTPPAFEAARRERKLLAMKAALEGRSRPGAGDSPAPEEALARVLERRDLDAGQRERLDAVLARWRRDGPKGSLRP